MSFRLKLFLGLLAVQAMFLAGTSIVGVDLVRKIGEFVEVEQGSANADLLALTLAEPLLFYDLARIEEALTALTRDKDVVYAAAYAPSGVLLAQAGALPGAAEPLKLPAPDLLPVTVLEGNHRNHFVAIRTGDDIIGMLSLGLSREDALSVLSDFRLRAVIAASVAFAVTLAISWGLAASLSRRLSRLRAATLAPAKGDLSARVAMTGQDEFTSLAQSFNGMAERIERNRDDLALRMRTDHLTGIPNRLATEEALDLLLASPDQGAVRVLHIDLDRFKQANDTFGHRVGDLILREVARRLTAAFDNLAEADPDARATFVGRIGGDEFLAMMPDLGDDGTIEFAQDMIMQLAMPIQAGGETVEIGASVGIALFLPGKQTDAADLLVRSDIALYEAKRAGGNRAILIDENLILREKRLTSLAADVRRGLARDEFVPHVQPQVDLESGALVGLEMLVRWQHPDRDVVTAGAFIHDLREEELVNAIDVETRRRAFSLFSELLEERPDLANCRLGINVRPGQLSESTFLSDLLELIESRGVRPDQVAIEILESTLLEGSGTRLLQNLKDIAYQGFSIELDDFGTGYSSISNLVGVAVSRIKIDQAFIRNVHLDPKKAAVVSAMVRVGHAFGAKVLAEGVETEEEIETVRRLGCDEAQGHGIARPMDFSALARWLDLSANRSQLKERGHFLG